MIYKTIDLCAGIGGIRRGFEMTGKFKNVLSAEIDNYACRTYELNFGENPKNDLTSDEFKKKVEETEYDVLLAGFPCQTFSRIGLQKGFRDTTKGTIFFDIADIISRTKPKAVFLENVENLVSHDKGKTIEVIVNTLEKELGYRIIGVNMEQDGSYSYSTKSFVRNSKKFGLPQNRPRAYIMAFSKEVYGDGIKLLTEGLPEESKKTIFADVSEILEKDVPDFYYMSSQYLETLKKHKAREKAKGNGFGYAVVNVTKGEKAIANTILATGGSGKERNLIYQPKEGIAGKELKSKRSPLNSEGIRVMTPTEWGRLQGFIGYAFVEDGVDKFKFPDGTANIQKYKQFGNSVTIPVIEEMAHFMLECFDKMANMQESIVSDMAKKSGSITKREVIERLQISVSQANYLLRKMVASGELKLSGRGRNAEYTV